MQDLKLHNSEYFSKQFRMIPATLEQLLNWVTPKITKSNVKREPVGA